MDVSCCYILNVSVAFVSSENVQTLERLPGCYLLLQENNLKTTFVPSLLFPSPDITPSENAEVRKLTLDK